MNVLVTGDPTSNEFEVTIYDLEVLSGVLKQQLKETYHMSEESNYLVPPYRFWKAFLDDYVPGDYPPKQRAYLEELASERTGKLTVKISE